MSSLEPPSRILPSSDVAGVGVLAAHGFQATWYTASINSLVLGPAPQLPVRGQMNAVTTLPTVHWGCWRHPLECQESWEFAISGGLDHSPLYPCCPVRWGLPLWSICILAWLSQQRGLWSGGSGTRERQEGSAEGGMAIARCVKSQIREEEVLNSAPQPSIELARGWEMFTEFLALFLAGDRGHFYCVSALRVL